MLPTLLLTLLALLCNTIAQSTEAATTYFNVTAVAAENGTTVLQCWQLNTPFTPATQAGIVGYEILSLGNLANGSYTIAPPRSEGGLHNAPYLQWVLVLSGLVVGSLPNTTAGPETEVWVQGGRYGIVFAADTKEFSQYGHYTTYPSDSVTVVVQLPAAGNVAPDHTILYSGPCKWPELAGMGA